MLSATLRALLVVLVTLSASEGSTAEPIDYRNFAIDTYYPNPNEIRVAEERARRWIGDFLTRPLMRLPAA